MDLYKSLGILLKYNKGAFTYDVSSRGGGGEGFEMLTVADKGGGEGV